MTSINSCKHQKHRPRKKAIAQNCLTAMRYDRDKKSLSAIIKKTNTQKVILPYR